MKEEITAVEIIHAIPGKAPELKKALAAIVPLGRSAKGCLQYDLLEPSEKREDFLILMRFKKLADLREHESSHYVAQFVQKYDQVLYDTATITEWKNLL